MFNLIFDAISIKLSDIFKDFFIYSEHIKQNFEKPCFFIKCLSIQKFKMLSSKSKILADFELTYFYHNSFNYSYENSEVLDEFLNKFDMININNKLLRPSKIDFNINDDNTLKIYLQFKFYFDENYENTEKMQKLFNK